MIETTHETKSPMTAGEMMAPLAFVDRLQRNALLVGVVGGAFSVLGAVLNTQQFYRSYLVAFMLWLGVCLGGMALLMVQYLTKGNWGFVLRRQYEACSRTLWLMALFFIPLVVAMETGSMYPWAITAKHGVGAEGGLTAAQMLMPKYHSSYYSPHAVIARSVAYFLFWFILIFQLNRWGGWQDQRDEMDLPRSRRFQKLAGPGVIIFVYTISLAVTDWVQTLDPTWFSTMYALIFAVAEALIAMCFCILLTNQLRRFKPVSEIMQPLYWHDIGNLTLTMVMLFAYFSFSSFLILWSGNLPEEVHWYLYRFNGGWGVWAMIMVFTMFAIPFFLLLHKPMKRNPSRLVVIASILFLARYIDLIWYIMPNFPKVGSLPNMHAEFHFSWQTVAIPIGMGGFWIAAFCRELKKRPLYPVYDLLWPEITREHHGH